MYYRIEEPDGKGGWKASGFYVDAYANIPLAPFSSNSIECSVKEDGGTAPIDWAPYVCSKSWARDNGKGLNPGPEWSVSAKPHEAIDARTNPGKARDEVQSNCTTHSTKQCVWSTATTDAFVLPREDWTEITNVYDSCPPIDEKATLTWTQSVSMAWSDNFGVKLTGSAKFLSDKLATGLELSWSHTVTETRTFGELITHKIPLGMAGALFLASGVVEMRGSFTIYRRDKVIEVSNAIVDFPLAREIRHRGQPVPIGVVHLELWKCGTTPPAPEPHPRPGESPGLLITVHQRND